MEEIPYQFEKENFILIFCDDDLLYQKVKDSICVENDFVRCLEGKEEKRGEEDKYIDELNIEDYIRKSKFIIYKREKRIEGILHKYILQYQKKIYLKKEFEENEFKNWLEEEYQESKIIIQIERWNEDIIQSEEKKNIYNISKEIKNIEDMNGGISEGIQMITYIRKIEGNDLLYHLQIKCVLENYKNKLIQNVVVIGKDIETFFQTIHYEKIENKKIILINDDDDNITFQDMFVIGNELFKNKIIFIVRSDVIFINSEGNHELEFDLLLDEKKIYCLSRIERDIHGRFVRIPPNLTLFNSVDQDGWIFKAPIECMDEKEIECIKDYDFNEKWSELRMNHYMKVQGYKLVNDIRNYKIVRVNLHPQFEVRELIKEPVKIGGTDFEMLPEYSYLENMSFEQMIDLLGISDEDKYQWKVDMMNRYWKKKLSI
jgi:hypothetical protein